MDGDISECMLYAGRVRVLTMRGDGEQELEDL